MKQNYSLQATTHANLPAGTRLQLLFTSLTVSNFFFTILNKKERGPLIEKLQMEHILLCVLLLFQLYILKDN